MKKLYISVAALAFSACAYASAHVSGSVTIVTPGVRAQVYSGGMQPYNPPRIYSTPAPSPRYYSQRHHYYVPYPYYSPQYYNYRPHYQHYRGYAPYQRNLSCYPYPIHDYSGQVMYYETRCQ